MMMRITYDEIVSTYHYRDGELYYKVSRGRKKAGDMVGGIITNGYKRLQYKRKGYLYHRVIYCYFNECDYDDISPWQIDHLDNDKLNNRIENLILCEGWENMLNLPSTKRNGTLGYDWYHRRGLEIPSVVNEMRMQRYHQNKNNMTQEEKKEYYKRCNQSRKTKTRKDNEDNQSRLYERMNGETIYHTNEDKDIIT